MHPLFELFTETTITAHSRFFQLTTSIFFIQVNYPLQRSVKANIISRIIFLRTYTISKDVLLKIDKTSSKLIVDLKKIALVCNLNSVRVLQRLRSRFIIIRTRSKS